MKLIKSPLYLVLVVLFIFSCGEPGSSQIQGNSLANEKSAYLKLHANNPVYWQPWGEKALKKAQEEDKLLIISIGYVSCHWCHVMEEESFSDDSTAAKMNENFVSIKVDREERPGIDKAYMNAAFLINGSGGWPLNVIAMPDGRPVYAGTYFPTDQWNNLLDFFIKTKKENPEKLLEQAASLVEGLNSIEAVGSSGDKLLTKNSLDKASNELLKKIDSRWGGREGSPKFPIPVLLEFQMQLASLNKDEKLLDHTLLTLDKILEGGIYDHLAGGFFRYSTDAYWRVPHFEKMLYDNGQLISLYANAYKLTKKPSYKKAIEETLQFMELNLTSSDGLFYASIDADSEGEEGKYYIWNEVEIEAAGLENTALVKEHFGIDNSAELDGKQVLYIDKSIEKLAKKYGSPDEVAEKLKADFSRLEAVRAKRIKPFHDQKLITSWNALMIIGYLNAYEAFEDPAYLTKALTALEYLSKNAIEKNIVRHIPGEDQNYLEDAVFLAAAMIKAYENTFDIGLLDKAREITNGALDRFKDPNSEFLYYSDPANGDLVVNIHEITDNVLPGSNSQMAFNLYQLGHYYYDSTYLNKAEKMLTLRLEDLETNPSANGNWGRLATMIQTGIYEVAITGTNALRLRRELAVNYLPNAIFLGTTEKENLELLENKVREGQNVIYVCKDKSCRLPVRESQLALKLMEY